MNRTIILMVINTVFNDMIVPSIIILTPLPIWSSGARYQGIRLNIHVSLIPLSGDLSGYRARTDTNSYK